MVERNLQSVTSSDFRYLTRRSSRRACKAIRVTLIDKTINGKSCLSLKDSL